MLILCYFLNESLKTAGYTKSEDVENLLIFC